MVKVQPNVYFSSIYSCPFVGTNSAQTTSVHVKMFLTINDADDCFKIFFLEQNVPIQDNRSGVAAQPHVICTPPFCGPLLDAFRTNILQINYSYPSRYIAAVQTRDFAWWSSGT